MRKKLPHDLFDEKLFGTHPSKRSVLSKEHSTREN
jgi:hypothetical protein